MLLDFETHKITDKSFVTIHQYKIIIGFKINFKK